MYRDKETREIIAGMLKENTGSHFLDSGGAYGRNHERNQGRDFENENRSGLTFRWDYIEYTINLYHFLTGCLEYDEDMNQLFRECYSVSPDEYSYLQIMDSFPDFLLDNHGIETFGIYGDGDPFVENTCNFDNALSQVIQFLYFETDDDVYIILQIHGGCDVRGGYTHPVVFRCDTDSFFNYSMGDISCKGCGLSWYSDDSYHWYINHMGNENEDNVKELQEYEITGITDFIDENELERGEREFIDLLRMGEISRCERLENQLNLIPDIPKPIRWEINDKIEIPDNVLFRDDEGIGLCPCCFNELECY